MIGTYGKSHMFNQKTFFFQILEYLLFFYEKYTLRTITIEIFAFSGQNHFLVKTHQQSLGLNMSFTKYY